jgi:hypothetical protein
VLKTSAKTGLGLEHVLPAIIERVSPPRGDPQAPLRALLFDAYHDEYRCAASGRGRSPAQAPAALPEHAGATAAGAGAASSSAEAAAPAAACPAAPSAGCRGVICLAAVVDGQLCKGERIASASSGQEHEVLECGLLTPEPYPTGRLLTGQVRRCRRSGCGLLAELQRRQQLRATA